MVRMQAAAFVAQSLADAGVTHVFGGHGGSIVPLVNAVVAHPDLEWVLMRHEGAASLAAGAMAKLVAGIDTGVEAGAGERRLFPGRLGCCIATSGPGAVNLLTGLLDAAADRVPVVCITGALARSSARHSEFQDVDQARLFSGAGVLSLSVTVSDPMQLIAVMRDSVALALTRRAVVHVAIPTDIQVQYNSRAITKMHFVLCCTL